MDQEPEIENVFDPESEVEQTPQDGGESHSAADNASENPKKENPPVNAERTINIQAQLSQILKDSSIPKLETVLKAYHLEAQESILEEWPYDEGLDEQIELLKEKGILVVISPTKTIAEIISKSMMLRIAPKEYSYSGVELFEFELDIENSTKVLEEYLGAAVEDSDGSSLFSNAEDTRIIIVHPQTEEQLTPFLFGGRASSQSSNAISQMHKYRLWIIYIDDGLFRKTKSKIHFHTWKVDGIHVLLSAKVKDKTARDNLRVKLDKLCRSEVFGDPDNTEAIVNAVKDKLVTFSGQFEKLLDELEQLASKALPPEENSVFSLTEFATWPSHEQEFVSVAILIVSHFEGISLGGFNELIGLFISEIVIEPTIKQNSDPNSLLFPHQGASMEKESSSSYWLKNRNIILKKAGIQLKRNDGGGMSLEFYRLGFRDQSVQLLEEQMCFLVQKFYDVILEKGLLFKEEMPESVEQSFVGLIQKMVAFNGENLGIKIPQLFRFWFFISAKFEELDDTHYLPFKPSDLASPQNLFDRLAKVLHALSSSQAQASSKYVSKFFTTLAQEGQLLMIAHLANHNLSAIGFGSIKWIRFVLKAAEKIEDDFREELLYEVGGIYEKALIRNGNADEIWELIAELNDKLILQIGKLRKAVYLIDSQQRALNSIFHRDQLNCEWMDPNGAKSSRILGALIDYAGILREDRLETYFKVLCHDYSTEFLIDSSRNGKLTSRLRKIAGSIDHDPPISARTKVLGYRVLHLFLSITDDSEKVDFARTNPRILIKTLRKARDEYALADELRRYWGRLSKRLDDVANDNDKSERDRTIARRFQELIKTIHEELKKEQSTNQ